MTTMTAADSRSEAKEAYDAFLAACPSRALLDRISDKWVSLVLVALADGSRRTWGAFPSPALSGPIR